MSYKTGTPNDLKNISQKYGTSLRWDILHEYCLTLDRDADILDVGCGDGNKMLFLLEQGFDNVCGVEYCSSMYKRRLREYPNLKMTEGNAENLIFFNSESFDVTYYCHVLEHLPNPELAILEASRILKKGGACIIGIPNGYHLADKLMRMAQILIYRKTDHLQKFSSKDMINLLESNGFVIEKVTKTYGSFDFIFDKRIVVPKFIKEVVYKICKKIYWKEIYFDFVAIKN